MSGFQKRQLIALLVALGLGAPAPAQPAGDAAAEPPADAARLDELFGELKQPGREDWQRIEAEIGKIWSRSGSPAMDLLLARGNAEIAAEEYPAAVAHLSALVDHAPDFAEGWNARATAFYMMGEYSLAIGDVEHVLVLNPRHFGALAGLAAMFESMDEPALALKAIHQVQALNPNRPNVNDAAKRLERMTGEAEL